MPPLGEEQCSKIDEKSLFIGIAVFNKQRVII